MPGSADKTGNLPCSRVTTGQTGSGVSKSWNILVFTVPLWPNRPETWNTIFNFGIAQSLLVCSTYYTFTHYHFAPHRAIQFRTAPWGLAANSRPPVWVGCTGAGCYPIKDGAGALPPHAGDLGQLQPGGPSLTAFHWTSKASQHLPSHSW